MLVNHSNCTSKLLYALTFFIWNHVVKSIIKPFGLFLFDTSRPKLSLNYSLRGLVLLTCLYHRICDVYLHDYAIGRVISLVGIRPDTFNISIIKPRPELCSSCGQGYCWQNLLNPLLEEFRKSLPIYELFWLLNMPWYRI